MTRDAEQQKYSEIAALVSITVGREQFRNAEPRFYTAWVKIGRTRIEQMSYAVHPITDIRRCYIATANLAASRIFFKQLVNRHDAHAAKLISILQNYECCIIV